MSGDPNNENLAKGMAGAAGQPSLTPTELELFNRIYDLVPEPCKAHERESDDKWDYGCAMIGGLAIVSVRKCTSGWTTPEETVRDWQLDPTCEKCPLSPHAIAQRK